MLANTQTVSNTVKKNNEAKTHKAILQVIIRQLLVKNIFLLFGNILLI